MVSLPNSSETNEIVRKLGNSQSRLLNFYHSTRPGCRRITILFVTLIASYFEMFFKILSN